MDMKHIPKNQGSRFDILTELNKEGIETSNAGNELALVEAGSLGILSTAKGKRPVVGSFDLGLQTRKDNQEGKGRDLITATSNNVIVAYLRPLGEERTAVIAPGT